MPIKAELDRGSYVSHYGLTNPWTLWLLKRAPELVALRPSEFRAAKAAPACPDCRCFMVPRPGGYACYRHEPPVRWRPALEVPKVKWAPHQPSALSLIGEDVDIEWSPELGGYVVVPLCTPTR